MRIKLHLDLECMCVRDAQMFSWEIYVYIVVYVICDLNVSLQKPISLNIHITKLMNNF